MERRDSPAAPVPGDLRVATPDDAEPPAGGQGGHQEQSGGAGAHACDGHRVGLHKWVSLMTQLYAPTLKGG